MKELSVEQKAKRYDEALGKARQLCDYPTSKPFISDLQDLFPELKESEDEQIRKEDEDVRKWLISQLEIKSDMNNSCELELMILKSIAWLEKQGKQNVDKVEPKFKVGDWIVFNGLTLLVNEVVQGYYRTISKGGIPNSYDWGIDYAARLWTIEDAKEGDVLVCESGWTCIFKTLVNEETFGSYCFMDSTEWFCGLGSECHTLKEEFVKAYNGKIQPAKKEQRDLFFKKMQESGYEWNAEKKVLKNLKPKFNVGDWIVSANGKVNQVISVDADNVDFDGYTLDDGVYFSGTWCNSYHLWTIKDVKDGDVLATDKGVFIYAKVLYNKPYAYCGIDKFGVFKDNCLNNNWTNSVDNIHPATIEQHELLFRKMKEEGYQWDKNKKELIKL